MHTVADVQSSWLKTSAHPQGTLPEFPLELTVKTSSLRVSSLYQCFASCPPPLWDSSPLLQIRLYGHPRYDVDAAVGTSLI